MIVIHNDEMRIPIKSWCALPEAKAIEQAVHLSKLPFAFKQICLMPDTHCGYGMPIGGVMATIGAVVPNAVGVDIGCGICAVKTSLTEITKEQLKKIMGVIREVIPVGFSHQSKAQEMPAPNGGLSRRSNIEAIGVIIEAEYDSACKQLGTLGGGNHFIEIQKGDDGHIWIMIHSGSRNLGKKVADYYNKLAVELNNKWHSNVPKEWQLAFLPLGDDVAQSYLAEMNYCVEFAFANRKLMMDRIKTIFSELINYCGFELMINIAHNYARIENHFGTNILVHRKGATSAREGEMGIIAGSQGTKSYIVKGLGNPESFMTCSHGAGRVMGRKEAQRTLSLEDEIKKLDEQGIIHGIRNLSDLDEASGAYKPIDVVMEEQKDLIKPIVELSPLAVIKG